MKRTLIFFKKTFCPCQVYGHKYVCKFDAKKVCTFAASTAISKPYKFYSQIISAGRTHDNFSYSNDNKKNTVVGGTVHYIFMDMKLVFIARKIVLIRYKFSATIWKLRDE